MCPMNEMEPMPTDQIPLDQMSKTDSKDQEEEETQELTAMSTGTFSSVGDGVDWMAVFEDTEDDKKTNSLNSNPSLEMSEAVELNSEMAATLA